MHRSWAQVGRLPLSEILEIHPLEQVLAQKSCYKQGDHSGGGGMERVSSHSFCLKMVERGDKRAGNESTGALERFMIKNDSEEFLL